MNAQKVVSDSNEMLEGHKCTARKSLRTIVECHKVSSVRLRPSGTAFLAMAQNGVCQTVLIDIFARKLIIIIII